MKPKIVFHEKDLPLDIKWGDSIAIDTEAMGLNHQRDRLCLVQLSAGDGVCHLVKINPDTDYTNLINLLTNEKILKIFHFARFDVAALYGEFGVLTENIYCTKIASKLTRTYTEKHSLKDLCKQLLDIEISKQEQQSDWGAHTYTEAQKIYAATDVLYLHQLKEKLDELLVREHRHFAAQSCFDFIMTRAYLDYHGFSNEDIFSH